MKTLENRGGDAIAQWYERKLADGFNLRSVRRIGRNFMEIVESSRADQINRLAFLRQNSVVIIPIIKTRKGVFTLLGEEYREGAAKVMKGFPAGSLDKEGEDILAAAKRELLEETPIQAEWIVALTEIDVGPTNYVSPGGTNEQIFYVRADIELPDDVSLSDLEGRECGVVAESEFIKTHFRELNFDLLYELEVANHKLALMMVLRENYDIP